MRSVQSLFHLFLLDCVLVGAYLCLPFIMLVLNARISKCDKDHKNHLLNASLNHHFILRKQQTSYLLKHKQKNEPKTQPTQRKLLMYVSHNLTSVNLLLTRYSTLLASLCLVDVSIVTVCEFSLPPLGVLRMLLLQVFVISFQLLPM